jgi:hypothetical protein
VDAVEVYDVGTGVRLMPFHFKGTDAMDIIQAKSAGDTTNQSLQAW